MVYNKDNKINHKKGETIMNNINNNLQRVKEFTEYLEHNIKEHTKTKNSETASYDEQINSLMFLRDYEEVLKNLNKVIDEYNKKTGSEF